MTELTSELAQKRPDEFSGTTSRDGFWRTDEADTVMQRGNVAAFAAMAEIEKDAIAGATVVDIGCNQGGFLQYLCDTYPVHRAFGLDPASGAIERARETNGDRPAEYVVGDRPPADWAKVDLAFSQEAVYLIHDLAQHADDMWRTLRPGGRYLAVTCVHSANERMSEWHRENVEVLELPSLRSVGDFIAPFLERGFAAEVGWLPIRFVPIEPDHLDVAWNALEFWTRTSNKVLFRFTRPA